MRPASHHQAIGIQGVPGFVAVGVSLMHASSVLGPGHQRVCSTGRGLQRGDRPPRTCPLLSTQGTTRGGCTRSPLPSLRQRRRHRHVPAVRTGRTCVPRWSTSQASWAASSPPSSSADSSPSSPGGWPPARSSPASSASTSTSTWQPPDWGELGCARLLVPLLLPWLVSPFLCAGGTCGRARGDISATSSRHDGFYASGPARASPAPAAHHHRACSRPAAAAPGRVPPAPLPLPSTAQ